MNDFSWGIMILLFIISFIFVGSTYIKIKLEATNFEEMLFYSLCMDMIVNEGGITPFLHALKEYSPFVILLSFLFYLLFFGISGNVANDFYPLYFIRDNRLVIVLLLLFISIIYALKTIGILDYLRYHIQKSSTIKNNYIDPKKTKVDFNKKNNLILIFVESLENTFFSKEHGGVWDYEIMNELHEILEDKETVNFFDRDTQKGMYMIMGSSFTSSSIFANNSGIPIKLGLSRRGYSKKKYLAGAYSLGELLKDNGYENEVISAASTTYGGFKEFYTQHGDYTIIDNDNINDFGIYPDNNQTGDWGLNDMGLFEVAKKRLDVLSKKNKPFNLQLITIDTHFFDGFIGDYSETKFKRRYENVFATTSRLIKEFVDHVKKQPYYKDTTIVIVGDHQAMQSTFINDKMSKNRTIYNCFINPVNKVKESKRLYTPLDLYPTIVSALGADIDGNKLALGANLFSNEKTLAERYGLKKMDNELKKRSKFYDEKILKLKK
jgi:phosphoglycerol transferase